MNLYDVLHMDTDTKRRADLLATYIRTKCGGSRAIFMERAGLTKGRVAQMLATGFGERAARDLEQVLGLPKRHFERQSDLTDYELTLLTVVRQLDAGEQQELLHWAQYKAGQVRRLLSDLISDQAAITESVSKAHNDHNAANHAERIDGGGRNQFGPIPAIPGVRRKR